MPFNKPASSSSRSVACNNLILNYTVKADDDSMKSVAPFGGNPALWMMNFTESFDYSSSHHAAIINLDRQAFGTSTCQDHQSSLSQVFPNTNWLDTIHDYPTPSPIHEIAFQHPASPAPSSSSSQPSSTLASYKEVEELDRQRSPSCASTLSDNSPVIEDADPTSTYHGFDSGSTFIPTHNASENSDLDSTTSFTRHTSESDTSLLIASPPEAPRDASRTTAKSYVTGSPASVNPEPGTSIHYATKSLTLTTLVFGDGSDITGDDSDFNSDIDATYSMPTPAPRTLPLKRSRSTCSDPDSDYHDDGNDEDFEPRAMKKRKVSAPTSSEEASTSKAPTKKRSGAASATATRKKTGATKYTSVAQEDWWWWDVSGARYRCLYGECGAVKDTAGATTFRYPKGIYDLRRHFEDIHGCREATQVNAGRLRLEQAFAYVQDLSSSILTFEKCEALRAEARSMLKRLRHRPSTIDFTDLPTLERFAEAHKQDFRIFDCKYVPRSKTLRPGKMADDEDKTLGQRPWGQADVTLGQATGSVCRGSTYSTVHKRRAHHCAKHGAPSAKSKSKSKSKAKENEDEDDEDDD
ncbi:hypothetical protein FRB98_008042 [Tulasnella sp. 332]|nr:hypothetical protein FRB98_008042 [Tulasnella sp. 332]